MFFANIPEDVLSMVSALGILQGLLLAALVYFHPKSDKSVNVYLALYILSLTLVMSGPLILKAISWQRSFFLMPLPLLVGPMMYLYIRSFRETVTFKKAWPHFVLFIAFAIAAYFWVEHLADIAKGAGQVPDEGFHSTTAHALIIIRYAQFFFYYFLTRRELAAYRTSIQHVFSDTDRIDLRWASWLINGFIVIILAAFLLFFLMLTYPSQFYVLYLLNIAVVTPYIYILSYKGITQPTIWQQAENQQREKIETQLHESEALDKISEEKSKNYHPVAPDSRSEEILLRLRNALEVERLYQESDLTLSQLAARLGFPSYQVSQAINNGMNKNFYELINSYRVEEAKKLLLHPEARNYTILSIGFEAGFNSKTTFNTVFKKFTGYTPTDFRQQQQVLTGS